MILAAIVAEQILKCLWVAGLATAKSEFGLLERVEDQMEKDCFKIDFHEV